MSEETSNRENPHLNNLVSRGFEDFDAAVAKEQNLANLLLKGHLYIENLLDETLAVYNVSPRKIQSDSFYWKIKALEKAASGLGEERRVIKQTASQTAASLFAVNTVRNNMAHNLSFELDDFSINRIGITLGRDYIVEKYKLGQADRRGVLIFSLKEIVFKLAQIIYLEIKQVEREMEKKKKNS